MCIEIFTMEKAQRLFYTGRVQGVGFRYSVKQLSAGFEVTGTVRNLPDGRVELQVQGEESEMAALLEAVRKSHLKGFIREIEGYDIPVDPSLRGFSILNGSGS
ncbi:MAG: acylphosphatase [Candidatus Methylacidiphilales bacterium]|nr:acylphosphatase [Candidatus Methylacidiphilales bacterium]